MKKEVLIIEDDSQMHEIYKDMLDPKKFNVTSVQEPLKALYMIQREKKKFDIILLDILMEDNLLDGTVFFVQLREALKDKTPVIVISVLNADQVSDLRRMDDMAFLHKPIEQKELLHEIDKALK